MSSNSKSFPGGDRTEGYDDTDVTGPTLRNVTGGEVVENHRRLVSYPRSGL